jgi:hypothetical protein
MFPGRTPVLVGHYSGRVVELAPAIAGTHIFRRINKKVVVVQ